MWPPHSIYGGSAVNVFCSVPLFSAVDALPGVDALCQLQWQLAAHHVPVWLHTLLRARRSRWHFNWLPMGCLHVQNAKCTDTRNTNKCRPLTLINAVELTGWNWLIDWLIDHKQSPFLSTLQKNLIPPHSVWPSAHGTLINIENIIERSSTTEKEVLSSFQCHTLSL